VITLAVTYRCDGMLAPREARYAMFHSDLYHPGTIQRLPLPRKKGSGVFVVNDTGNFYANMAKDRKWLWRAVEKDPAGLFPLSSNRWFGS
jgi:hypothetical protein